MARRAPGDKVPAALARLDAAVVGELARQQQSLLDEARDRREAATVNVDSLDDAREAGSSGWARIGWDRLDVEGEAELARHGVTVRCLVRADGTMPRADDESDLVALCARTY
jgi:prolyl-tRNA synthetase